MSSALQNVSGELIKRLREDTSFHDKDYKLPFERGENSPLVLPWIHDTQYRVIYDIVEFAHLMNSSSIHLDDWVHLAKEVEVRIILKNSKLSICVNLFACRIITNATMASSYCTAETPWRLLPQLSHLCWRILPSPL